MLKIGRSLLLLAGMPKKRTRGPFSFLGSKRSNNGPLLQRLVPRDGERVAKPRGFARDYLEVEGSWGSNAVIPHRSASSIELSFRPGKGLERVCMLRVDPDRNRWPRPIRSIAPRPRGSRKRAVWGRERGERGSRNRTTMCTQQTHVSLRQARLAAHLNPNHLLHQQRQGRRLHSRRQEIDHVRSRGGLAGDGSAHRGGQRGRAWEGGGGGGGGRGLRRDARGAGRVERGPVGRCVCVVCVCMCICVWFEWGGGRSIRSIHPLDSINHMRSADSIRSDSTDRIDHHPRTPPKQIKNYKHRRSRTWPGCGSAVG